MIITDFNANYIKNESLEYCSKLEEYTISKDTSSNNFAKETYHTKEFKKRRMVKQAKYKNQQNFDFIKIS